ncbi:hypothetical protein GCM10008931_20350 [Oceanobacillus oncorhynchi subsp. oncorhynchi]
MILLHILTIVFTLIIGYLVFFNYRNVMAGFLIVFVLALFFPIVLGSPSFLLVSLIFNIVGYVIIIKFIKKGRLDIRNRIH